MADLQGYPFESGFTGFDERDNPIFDRAIASATYRHFWKKYFTNGIFFEPSTNYQALAAGGMEVDVSYGEAHIEGLTILPGDAPSIRLTLPNALTTGDRTDMIVLRADFTANRSATVYVLPGKEHVADLQRDESVWELGLAKVLVRRNATSVNQADITDLRLSNEYCGLVTEPITRTNTQAFFAQLVQAMTNHEAQWDTFFAEIGSDIGSLLEHATLTISQIEGLQEALDAIPDQLSAQNEQIQQQFTAQNEAVDAALASKAATATYTATIPATGWTGSAAPYSLATVAVAGLLATDNPVVDIVQTGTEATDSVMREDWGKIVRIVTSAGGISVYADEVPTAAIPIQLKVVR